jgi:ATP-binding cassette subfamily C exporter for protease/lipase
MTPSTAPPNARGGAPAEAPLRQLIATQRPLFVRAAWLSMITGTLMLVPAWFMFEVYGRVLDSRNKMTLLMLLVLVIGTIVVIQLLEYARTGLLARAAEAIDQRLRTRLFDVVFDANLRRTPGGTPQAFGDLRTLRDFIPSPAVTAVMDGPSALLMLVFLSLLSPWLGVMALVGAMIQGALAWITERRTMPQLNQATGAAIEAQNYASASLRNAQVIEAMGMLGSVHQRWMQRQRRFLGLQAGASDVAGLTATLAKLVQTMQGSLLLGAACWLALHDDLWGGMGMMIVASILGGRVLGPLAQLVPQWRLVVNARDAYRRLNQLLAANPETLPAMPLPAPKGNLTVENVIAAAPGSTVPILRGVGFMARPGEVVAVVGPSASGKTTLARVMLGLWPASAGKVRLDGADIYNWNKAELGPHIGYLPQGVELFDGTVAENIARFGDVDMAQVQAVATELGLADTIAAMPQGYDTRIGDDGAVLSGGQRQRVALARALYGRPQLVVLDEPNASLDEEGEKVLLQVLQNLKARGATVIAITHRTTLLPVVDKLLVLNEGQTALFGPRDEVLAALKKGNEQARAQAAARPAAAQMMPAAPQTGRPA